MVKNSNIHPKDTWMSQEQGRVSRKFLAFTLGVRAKLILIFLLIKVLPLVLLAYIAWLALIALGTVSQEVTVPPTKDAITAMAIENIERITTDTAQKVAEFLYQRDADISFLARACKFRFSRELISPELFERLFVDFSEEKLGLIRRHGDWKVNEEDGMSWVQIDPYIPPVDTGERSTNCENNDRINNTSFRYRAPHGFGDHPNNFVRVPLYDEIALLNKNGMQIAKYVTPHSTKKRFPFPEELLDVSDPKNTFIRAERYFEELLKLGKDDIYVSEVIGAHVPTSFIGMYTPDYRASRRINAKVAALEDDADGKITEISWRLRVLSAELTNAQDAFNSTVDFTNIAVRREIDRRLGRGRIWEIKNKSLDQVAEELKTLGFPELAEEIVNIPFEPEKDAYAGAENPQGIPFEGIIRWAKPVVDDDNEIQGYITFALNHDHLLDMVNHITPMPERYSELSDAFHGNYAFIWDYKCRSIVHPRHHSIVGYNPETGKPETPWLESTLNNDMLNKGFKREDWHDYIATLTDYVPFAPNPERERRVRPDGITEYSVGYTREDINPDKPDGVQVRVPTKTPARALTALGLVGLDGRYLNQAPQCTGWMDLTRDGGSGSFYILWSGLYKPTTAAAIPYYTGKYAPEVQGNWRGFGFVTVGAGIDEFVEPAETMATRLEYEVYEVIRQTTFHLIWATVLLSVVVIFIAIWMASYLSSKLQWLIDGITKFRQGRRNFRFAVDVKDEFGQLAHSFDEMAENIVHSVHTPLVITDMDLNIIYANDQALGLLGTTLLDIFGQSYKTKSIYNYGSPYCPITALHEGRDKPDVLYVQQPENSSLSGLLWSNPSPDSEKRDKADAKSPTASIGCYLQGIANYLLNECGEKQGYIITSNDVTELSRKHVELELASRHKSRFLARMSHELRTPMNAIIGINEITQSKLGNTWNLEDQEELYENLEHLRRSSRHLLRLLNDILEASNLESEMVTLVEKPVDVSMMIAEISAELKPQCADKKLNWEMHSELTTTHFLTDGLRLHQALRHLLDNAIKYTPEHGNITFMVREKEREDGKVLLSFAIKDTGSGIPEDKQKMIFLPFEQAEAEDVKYTTGSGLGLVIVRKILELFNTQIVLKSEVGKGSEFAFHVWLQEEEPSKSAVEQQIKGRYAGQKALVVDDVHVNRIVLVNLLQEAGFTVDGAKDGKEGVEMFEQSPEHAYSIIFMDIQMPVMDGWESAKIIRRLPRTDAKTVPIVTISANAFPEDVEKSLASGMNAHYAKPIEKAVLAEILGTYCKPTS